MRSDEFQWLTHHESFIVKAGRFPVVGFSVQSRGPVLGSHYGSIMLGRTEYLLSELGVCTTPKQRGVPGNARPIPCVLAL